MTTITEIREQLEKEIILAISHPHFKEGTTYILNAFGFEYEFRIVRDVVISSLIASDPKLHKILEQQLEKTHQYLDNFIKKNQHLRNNKNENNRTPNPA